MRLLCHNVRCEGHDHRAGTDPTGLCRYCGSPLVDGHGVLLLEPELEPMFLVDLNAVEVCAVAGHVWEGGYPPQLEELRGMCSRCGLRISLMV